MQDYRPDKLKIVCQICWRIESLPTAWGVCLLAFGDGFNVTCRSGSLEWVEIRELFFAGGYQRSAQFLKRRSGALSVLELGENIGTLALLAARIHAHAEVLSYEPGPPNFWMFEMNRLANLAFMNRIELSREAVVGRNHDTEGKLDEASLGGFGFYAVGRSKCAKCFSRFAEVLKSVLVPAALAMIGSKGAEPNYWRKRPCKRGAIWARSRFSGMGILRAVSLWSSFLSASVASSPRISRCPCPVIA